MCHQFSHISIHVSEEVITQVVSPASTFSRLGCTVVDAVQALPGMAEPSPPPAEGTTPDEKPVQYQPSGAWTAFGIWLVLLIIANIGEGFAKTAQAVEGFATLNLDAIRAIDNSFTSLLSTLAAVLVIEAPLVIVIGVLLSNIYGAPKSNQVGKLFTGIKRHYLQMTVLVVAEELLARGLFLGVPLWLTDGHLSTAAFFALFVLGNSLWAVIHLRNFKDKGERRLLWVLPQFLGGVFLTIVFVNFGLLGAIMTHLAWNYLLMSTMRKGTFNKGEILVIVWHALVGAVSYALLVPVFGKSIIDLSRWFDHNGHDFVIPGWQIQHYLLAALLMSSVITILAEVLLLDLHPTQIEAAGLDGVGQAVVVMALTFIAYFSLQAVGVAFDTRVLIMALVFLLVRKSASGSGMARVFWISLPMLMFQLYAILALGWNSAAWLIAMAVAFVELPDRWLRIQDAKWEGRDITHIAGLAVRLPRPLQRAPENV